MPPPRLKLLQYSFLRYGGRIASVGRHIIVLQAWDAFLAGADWMPWLRFALINADADLLWAFVWGLSAYALGHASVAIIEWVSVGVSVVIIAAWIVGCVNFRRHEEAFEACADEVLPGPLRPQRRQSRRLAEH